MLAGIPTKGDETMLRNTLFATAALAVLATASPARAQDGSGASQADQFRQGLADRTAWENWFGGLAGERRAGAFYWSAQRSLTHPGSCLGTGGTNLGEFTLGCAEAQRMLAMTDVRRKSEPDYRIGWNAYAQSPTGYPVPAPYVPAATPVAPSGDPALCMETDEAARAIAQSPSGLVGGSRIVAWHNIRMVAGGQDGPGTYCTAAVDMNDMRRMFARYSFVDGYVRVLLTPMY